MQPLFVSGLNCFQDILTIPCRSDGLESSSRQWVSTGQSHEYITFPIAFTKADTATLLVTPYHSDSATHPTDGWSVSMTSASTAHCSLTGCSRQSTKLYPLHNVLGLQLADSMKKRLGISPTHDHTHQLTIFPTVYLPIANTNGLPVSPSFPT